MADQIHNRLSRVLEASLDDHALKNIVERIVKDAQTGSQESINNLVSLISSFKNVAAW